MRYLLALFLVAVLVGSAIAIPIENAAAAAQDAQDGLAKAAIATHHNGSLSTGISVPAQPASAEGEAKIAADAAALDEPFKKLMEKIPAMMGAIFGVTKTFLKDTLPHGIALALGKNLDD